METNKRGRMAITHNWKIIELFQINNGSGTVSEINCQVTSTDGDITVDCRRTIKLDIENIKNFVPYDQLDEQTVINWVKTKFAENDIDLEDRNVSVIDEIKNPPKPLITTEYLPWVQPQPVVEEPTPDPVEEESQTEEPVVEEPTPDPVEEESQTEEPVVEEPTPDPVEEESQTEEPVVEELYNSLIL